MGSLTPLCIVVALAKRAIKDDIAAFANYHPSSCANISLKYILHACLPTVAFILQQWILMEVNQSSAWSIILHDPFQETRNSKLQVLAKLKCPLFINVVLKKFQPNICFRGGSGTSKLPKKDIFLSYFFSFYISFSLWIVLVCCFPKNVSWRLPKHEGIFY